MAVLEILHVGNPTLRRPAREVEVAELSTAEVQGFIDDLVETMRAAKGAGLAATQLGRPYRIFAVEVQDNPRYPYKPNVPLTVVVNPVVTPLGDETFDNYEGCLSVPNLRGVVARFADVRVTGLGRDGQPFERRVRGLTAGTFQHEVDHLGGTLFLDKVTDPRTFCTWAEFDRFHKQAFVERITAFIARMGG